MELIEGITLQTQIEQTGPGGLPLTDVELLFNQMAAALAYCHTRQVIHRDIKSPNVMWDRQANRYVLVDFGLSLQAGEPMSQEQRGTPEYMAPEQFEGKEPTFQTDIYSLGVVLYEALTGQLPFGRPPSADVWRFYSHTHRYHEVISIHRLRGDVPARLENAIMGCLAYDPHQRFADGAALADYLSRFLSVASVQSLPQREPPPAGRTLPAPDWAKRVPTDPEKNPTPDPPLNSDAIPRSASQTGPSRRSRRLLVLGLVLLATLLAGYWLLNRLTASDLLRSPTAQQQVLDAAQTLQQAGEYEQAAELYRQLVEVGNLPAHQALFKLYMGGHAGGTDRCRKAFEVLKAAANANDYQACNLLGYVYEFGEYINPKTGKAICRYPPNPQRAFFYVKKAAEGGHSQAMWQLANFYQRGFGTPVDGQAADRWRQKAQQTTDAN